MKYEYIKRNGIYYVPRASVCILKERDEAFKSAFGESPLIVSPMEWAVLQKFSEILYLEKP